MDGKVKARLEERIKILSVNKPDDDAVSKCEAVVVDDQGIHTPLDSMRSGRDQSNDYQTSMQKSQSTRNMKKKSSLKVSSSVIQLEHEDQVPDEKVKSGMSKQKSSNVNVC